MRVGEAGVAPNQGEKCRVTRGRQKRGSVETMENGDKPWQGNGYSVSSFNFNPEVTQGLPLPGADGDSGWHHR